MTDIQWPWQYNFPPFFTIQPNRDTRKKQLDAWKSLILKYYKRNNLYILDLANISHIELFNNASISRSLSKEDVLVILEYLSASGNAKAIDKSQNRWYIYWHSLEEWASIILKWVQKNNQSNTVLTFYEIINTPNEEFSGLEQSVLVDSLKLLEREGNAEIIEMGDNLGVKFFS